ncbi:MAG: hypothetical protein RIR86_1299, partial [Acidobacteriota bacterium]
FFCLRAIPPGGEVGAAQVGRRHLPEAWKLAIDFEQSVVDGVSSERSFEIRSLLRLLVRDPEGLKRPRVRQGFRPAS